MKAAIAMLPVQNDPQLNAATARIAGIHEAEDLHDQRATTKKSTDKGCFF